MAWSGRTEAAYFKMINEMGGVNGRKINLISVDDGYSPPKTVEQIRRLVEQEQVALIFQSLGTTTNAAIRSYLNDNKVPQLFIATGDSMSNDPKNYPWTMPFDPNFRTEAHISANTFEARGPTQRSASSSRPSAARTLALDCVKVSALITRG
jgi:ABC-type branched-subunit amino acid transport system substrate-binding protein